LMQPDFNRVHSFLDKFRKETFKSANVKECWNHYDTKETGFLNVSQVKTFLRDLFVHNEQIYKLSTKEEDYLLCLLGVTEDNEVSFEEFKKWWELWIRDVLNPISAIIIVDVQNDFIDGSLSLRNCPAHQNANEIIPIINSLREVPWDVVAITKDWHPKDHCSFHSNLSKHELHDTSKIQKHEAKVFDVVTLKDPVVIEQKLWHDHCIQGTWGAELHKDLIVKDTDYIVYKGTNSKIDSYSAFWDNSRLCKTDLHYILAKNNVTDVYICGLAFDVCVGSTALHAIELGYRTLLIKDGCKGVSEDSIAEMEKHLQDVGGILIDSKQVMDLVKAQDRRVQMVIQTLENMQKARKVEKSVQQKIRFGLADGVPKEKNDDTPKKRKV